MTLHWYALRTKPRKEEVVWRQVCDQGYDSFYPQLRVNPVNPRARKVRPYFPGYMFVRVDINAVGLSVFQWMPHAIGIVSFGSEPATVPDHLLHAISQKVKQISEAGGEVFDGLKSGDTVVIDYGPFEGYEAIFDARVPGTERVKVLLELIASHRRVPVELQASHIRQKK